MGSGVAFEDTLMSEVAARSGKSSPPQFELTVSIPAEPRFVATVRDLAIHAAQYAGCLEAEATEFGAAVEQAVRQHLTHTPSDAPVAVVVRRNTGPLEVLVDEQTITLDL